MSDFASAIEVVLKHEGGFANIPDDPGGPTNYGLSQRWLEKKTNEKWGLDKIKGITRPEAICIYLKHWWLPIYEKINRQVIGSKIFDMAVNMGHPQAHKIAQKACNALHDVLVVDGDLGPCTLKELNAADPGEHLIDAMIAHQMEFYQSLIVADPKKQIFRNGWMDRAKWPL